MEEQLGALGLVLNCIVLWNTFYMNAAIEALRAEGYPVRDKDLARLSPFVRYHLGVHGRYSFVLPTSPAAFAHCATRTPKTTTGSSPRRLPAAMHGRHGAGALCGCCDRVWSATVAVDKPTDADQLVRDLLAQGSESHVDYKTAMSAPTDRRDRAKLAKHAIGLSNRKDGGYLLIGVEDGTHRPVGLIPDQVATWDAAKLNAALAPYAAPPPVVQVFRGSLTDGTVLLALHVVPFDEQPLVCTKSVEDDRGKTILREGALYIRTAGTETKEVSTEAEMRELLSRAYVKKADRLLAEIKALIDAHWPGSAPPAAVDLLRAIEHDLDAMKKP